MTTYICYILELWHLRHATYILYSVHTMAFRWNGTVGLAVLVRSIIPQIIQNNQDPGCTLKAACGAPSSKNKLSKFLLSVGTNPSSLGPFEDNAIRSVHVVRNAMLSWYTSSAYCIYRYSDSWRQSKTCAYTYIQRSNTTSSSCHP